ncbi:hypothetical protein ACFW0H_11980 [Pseudomonas sp. CR3202]
MVLPDSLIGIAPFVPPVNGASYFIIVGFGLGQWGSATSAMAFPRATSFRKNPSAPSREIGYSN